MRVLHRVKVGSEGQPIDKYALVGGAVVWPRPYLPYYWLMRAITIRGIVTPSEVRSTL
jgi:hypothetical protein